MTQQPYYPPQAPQQFQAPVAPPYQQPYAQPPVQQFQPQYASPQQYGAPQQPPAPPLVNGSLDAFYSQPTGGGPGVSWKGKPNGYTIQGVVQRDVGDGDVTQEVGAPNTAQAGQPLTYRDGRPKFVLAVPLQVAQSQEFPDGDVRLFVRGQLREELTRAMSEAGVTGSPKGGAIITVTLVERKQGRGTIPQNIFRVVYTPAGHPPPAVQQPQPQQYAQQPIPPSYEQPTYPPAQQPQHGYASAPAPAYPGGQPPAVQQPQVPQVQFQPPVAQAPVQQPQQAAPGAPSPVPGAPVQQGQPQPGAPQPPAGIDPAQAALIAQITGQPQQGQPA